MTDLLLAKISILFSLMLGVVIGPSYIQVETENLSFNFNTGENYPIIRYLNVKNIGTQKARFDISSNVSWADVFKEGDTGALSVELSEQAAVNFVLQINAQYAKDGVNNAEITLSAVSLTSQAQTVLDTKKIKVVLNKNVTSTILPTNTPVPALTPVSTPSSDSGQASSPQATPASTTRPVPTPSARYTPIRTAKPTPAVPTSISAPPAQLRSIATPRPTPSVSAQPQSQKRTTLPRSFWHFFRNLFF